MHKLYELKDQLCKELESYADRQTLDLQTLDVIDKLAHSTKNICKIIEFCEQDSGYNGSTMTMPYGGQFSYTGSPMPHYNMRGTPRDSMGRYTRSDSSYSMQLQNLIDNAPNEQARQKLMSVMNDM